MSVFNNSTSFPDVYYNPDYCKLYEDSEKGTCETFEYSDENGSAINIFIKRPVPWKIDGIQYFDIVTPYGYGGPIILSAINRTKLVEAFWQNWKTYCEEEKIICEFVRFHPLLKNYVDFKDLYDASFNRYTLAIELKEDFFATQFSSKCRNTTRKAEKLGLTVEIDEDCANIEDFVKIYYKTMEKDSADSFYFFPIEYFKKMKEVLGDNLILISAKLGDEIVSASLFAITGKYMHYHLSGTNPEYYNYSGNNLVLKAAADWGVAHGLEWFHLGGGVSSDPEDSLYKFKRAFAREEQNLKEFWIGKNIYNKRIYDLLVEKRKESAALDEDSNFFPKYRT